MTRVSNKTPLPFLSLRIGKPGARRPEVRASGEMLPVLPLEGNGGWHVPVPGWLWAMQPGTDALSLRIKTGRWGLPRRRVLTRQAVATRLDERISGSDTADFEQISALEHCHHGDLYDLLAEDTQAWLRDIAQRHGLSRLLPAGARINPADTAHLDDNPALQIRLARLGRAVRAVGDDSAVGFLRDMLDDMPADADTRQAMAEELTSHFCRIDRIGALYDILFPDQGADAIHPDPARPWRLVTALPAALLRGDSQALPDALTQLNADPDLWCDTTTLAWCLTHAAAPDRGPVWQSFLNWLETQAQRKSDAAACEALMRAACALLHDLSLIQEPARSEIEAAILRCYALSTAFWRICDDMELPAPSDRFAALKSDAKTLLGAGSTPRSDLHHARDRLREASVCGLDQIELERLGPSGPAHPLRRYAAPNADPVADADRHALTVALRAAYTDLPSRGHVDQQRQLVSMAHRLLSEPEPGCVDDCGAAIAELSKPEVEYFGISIGMSLLHDLQARGHNTIASMLKQSLIRQVNTISDDPTLADNMSLQVALAPHLRQPNSDDLLGVIPGALQSSARQLDLPGPPAGTALFDCLVVICSRHAEPDQPPRHGWIADLKRYGIPHLFVIAGDQTRLDGNRLGIAGSDAPENQPRLRLDMLRWISDQSPHAHVLIMGDSCELDVDAMFLEQTYRMFPYYGRRLQIPPAQIDRTAHQPFCQDQSARLALDKLPAPALFADSGTGITLSRPAIRALLHEAATPAGQALQVDAFCPDRLIGALLDRVGIDPREADYHTARFHGDPARPNQVSGVWPGPLGVTKAAEQTGSDTTGLHHGTPDTLKPPRIWPLNAPPRLGIDSAALHLLSPQSRLLSAERAPMVVVCVLRNEAAILPAFLAHYRAMGVDQFLIVDNGSSDGTLDALLAEPDVSTFHADTEFRKTDQGTDWKIALLAQYRADRWGLVADADEFLILPTAACNNLPGWLAQVGELADCVRVAMLDMYPAGPLSDAPLAGRDPFNVAPFVDRQPFLANTLARGPFSNGPTWTSAARHRLMPGSPPNLFVAQKYPLIRYRSGMRFSTSLHYATGTDIPNQSLLFAHFKYHAEFAAKVEREIERAQYFNNALEYRKYRALVAEGRDALFCEDVSIHWRDCSVVQSLLNSLKPDPAREE